MRETASWVKFAEQGFMLRHPTLPKVSPRCWYQKLEIAINPTRLELLIIYRSLPSSLERWLGTRRTVNRPTNKKENLQRAIDNKQIAFGSRNNRKSNWWKALKMIHLNRTNSRHKTNEQSRLAPSTSMILIDLQAHQTRHWAAAQIDGTLQLNCNWMRVGKFFAAVLRASNFSLDRLFTFAKIFTTRKSLIRYCYYHDMYNAVSI